MKTLKQLLDEYQEETEEIYWEPKGIKYCVKKWLTQKRQDWIKNCPSDTEYALLTTLFDELLEELNQ